jgi:putative phosphoesterase
MKLIVLADIHGNLPALKAVLKDIRDIDVDKILVAGDILGGPFPVEVIRILRDLNASMIQGNFEGYLMKIYSNPMDSRWYKSKQWSPTYWVYKRLNQYWLNYLKSLPKEMVVSIDNCDEILMIHCLYKDMLPVDASGIVITDKYDEILESYSKSMHQSVVVFAHNHVPYSKKFNGILALNPGSVGCPLDGTVGAQYAILKWKQNQWEAEERIVNYSIEEITKAFSESGYLKKAAPLSKLILKCIQTGKAYMEPFFKYLHDLAEKNGYGNNDIIPDKIVSLAEETWDWKIFE